MVRWNAGTEHVKIQRLIDSQDIYAVTAPLAVEALERLLSSPKMASGTLALGGIFDAGDFLKTLTPEYFAVDFCHQARCSAAHENR